MQGQGNSNSNYHKKQKNPVKLFLLKNLFDNLPIQRQAWKNGR